MGDSQGEVGLVDTYHAPDCNGAGCDGCGYIAADGLWYPGPTPPEDEPFQEVRAEGRAEQPTIVLVRQSHGDPVEAELRETDPRRPHIVKVVYLHSRTAAWISRARILPTVEEQLRAAGIPLVDPIGPAEVEAELDLFMAESEPERRADRLEAGIVDSYTVGERPATMSVRVADRRYSPVGHATIRTVTISTSCPVCGGPRGLPFNHNFYDDGEWMSCDRWDNPCGHVDMYDAVLREASEMEGHR